MILGEFWPLNSPWSNGLNKQNHTSVDTTIKKLTEEEKVTLSDSLVKAAAWTHNTSINNLGYSPLLLGTGKAVTIPGLTMGNIATETMANTEAVSRIFENLMNITSEFRESDMRKKLNECQGVLLQAYQHRGNYIEGDKVWFQPLNGNTWLGPAVVVYQRGQSVYLHIHGDLKKIAAYRVKPFEWWIMQRRRNLHMREN